MTAPVLTRRQVCAHEAVHAPVAYSVGMLIHPAAVHDEDAREANAEVVIISEVPIRACRSNA